MVFWPFKPLLVWQESIQSFCKFGPLQGTIQLIGIFRRMRLFPCLLLSYLHCAPSPKHLQNVWSRNRQALQKRQELQKRQVLSEEVGTPEEGGAFRRGRHSRRGRCFQKRQALQKRQVLSFPYPSPLPITLFFIYITLKVPKCEIFDRFFYINKSYMGR